MSFSVTILGTSSAVPNSKRNPSSQVVNLNQNLFLVDCGEGTQIQLRKNKLNLSKIKHIFISHLHGDHVFGLFGLLSTYSLLGRDVDLHIYANEKLKEIIESHNKFFNNKLTYKIIFHFLNEGEKSLLYEDKFLMIKAFPLKHSIACHGFVFKEKPKLLNIKKYKIAQYNIPISEINKIKNGADFLTEDGQLIHNQELTIKSEKPCSYAYCSDTAFYPKIINEISQVDLLYHESTFANTESKRAQTTQHSTAEDAATIAKEANVKSLLLGHFSTRYSNLDILLNEAKSIFRDTEIAIEGKTYKIDQNEESDSSKK